MAYEAVADGELAAVVTYLEMLAPPDNEVPASPLSLRRIENPQPGPYRELFRTVGAPWLWFSRLMDSDERLSTYLRNPALELFAVMEATEEVGMIELDFRNSGECELAYLGLVPRLAGKGHGRWLLAEAVRRAWRDGIRRVHVHTCSLDHPAALSAYQRAGFTPYKRAIERFPDPRLIGILPRDCAPRIPLIGA